MIVSPRLDRKRPADDLLGDLVTGIPTKAGAEASMSVSGARRDRDRVIGLMFVSAVFDCHIHLGGPLMFSPRSQGEFHALLRMFTGGTVMSATATRTTPAPAPFPHLVTAGQELAALGWEINANQYRVVHLAARFDEELEWVRLGHRSASSWIASQLQMQTSTAREWIRVGHALRYLPLIDLAFAAGEVSYAKVRILTRWADDDNEALLLDLARERNASRLTVAIARAFADHGETDAERDVRLHESRSLTTWTDGDGMVVMRIVLAPSVAKPVVAAVDELVRRIARTPMTTSEATAVGDRCDQPIEATDVGDREPTLSAGASDQPSVSESSRSVATSVEVAVESLPATLSDLRRRWQPDVCNDWVFPSVGQQRADAFVALFLGCDVELTTEVVVHVRGDGITFDDGTPTTGHAVLRHIDGAFIRLLIHDAERRPINASSRQRLATTRQKRVVMEAHGHECADCQSTDLLELDHNPAFERTRRTVTHELEPRCAPCHRARHRLDRMLDRDRVAELPPLTPAAERLAAG